MQERASFLDYRCGRRDFLKLGVIGLVSFNAGVSIFTQGCSEERNALSDADVLTAISRFELEAGDQLLTFEQARAYLPFVAELFVKSANSTKRPKDIVNDMFIVRRDFKDFKEMENGLKLAFNGTDEKVSSNPIIQQLKSDYSSLNLSKGMARRILFAMSVGDASAVVESGRIFLVLDRINGRFVGSSPEKVTNEWQFQGSKPPVICSPISPAVTLRSTALHEMVHYDADKELKPLERDFLEAYQKVKKQPSAKGEKSNFALLINGFSQTDFNEFVTDYISSMISIKSGLPYTLGYGLFKHKPSDLVNFGKVLEQSEIDEHELLKMYRGSQLETFMMRVAKAAKNITFQNKEDMYAFSVKHFLLFMPIIWPDLKVVFPEVDTAVFEFVDSSVFRPRDPRGFLWIESETGQSFFRETKLGCK